MKTKKLLSIGLSALMITSVFGAIGAMTAYADDDPDPYDYEDGVSITKTVNAAEGSAVNATFKYGVVGKNGSDGTAPNVDNWVSTATVGYPTFSDLSVTVDVSAAETSDSSTVAIPLADVTWPVVGTYAFTISEKPLDNRHHVRTDGKDYMTEDDTTYTMRVYVIEKNGEKTIEYVTLQKDGGDKVTTDDAEPGSKLAFESTYTEKAGGKTGDGPDPDPVNPDPDNPDDPDFPTDPSGTDPNFPALKFTKTITTAEKSDTFEASIVINVPAGTKWYDGNDWSYRSITVAKDNDGTAQSLTAGTDYTISNSGDNTTITFSGNNRITDGTALYFYNIPAGATYTVNETVENTQYTATGTATYNSAVQTPNSGTLNTNYSHAGNKIGDQKNSYALSNAKTDITVTGLLLNVLPFIVLGALAVAGIIGYTVIKRKLSE